MRIVSLAKRKGGVGASSLTIMLAASLVKYANKKVLVLDTDAQRTISDLSELDKRKRLEPLFDVESIEPVKVQTFLKRWGNDYEIIFIDLPRMTSTANDDTLVSLLYLCDSLLLPIVPSQLSVLSTIPFIEVVKDIVAQRAKMDFETHLHGCLSLATHRSYSKDATDFFQKQGLSMFDHQIHNLKIFSSLSTATSPLDTKEGKTRFEGFYNEFLTKFNIQ